MDMLKRKKIFACMAFAVACTSLQATQVEDKDIGYWSIWSDDAGISHQSYCKLDDLTLQQFSVAGDPEWVSNFDMKTTRYVFNIMPPNWTGTWHKSPKPQWTTTLSGNWYIETMDGHRVELPAGSLSFGYDVNAKKQADGKYGHLSGAIGTTPTRILVVQVEGLPTNVKDKRCLAGGTFIK